MVFQDTLEGSCHAYKTCTLKQLIVRTVRALARRLRRAHEHRQLAQLDPRELSDAGITAGDRMAELSKPFWRH